MDVLYARARARFSGFQDPYERVMVSLLCTDENKISGWAGSGEQPFAGSSNGPGRCTARKRGTGKRVDGRAAVAGRDASPDPVENGRENGSIEKKKNRKRRGGASTTCTTRTWNTHRVPAVQRRYRHASRTAAARFRTTTDWPGVTSATIYITIYIYIIILYCDLHIIIFYVYYIYIYYIRVGTAQRDWPSDGWE